MYESQAQFANKFGFPPATLRNWEQGRARPDAPTRVLLAVIAKHPEAANQICKLQTYRRVSVPCVPRRATGGVTAGSADCRATRPLNPSASET